VLEPVQSLTISGPVMPHALHAYVSLPYAKLRIYIVYIVIYIYI
jgi:hypothetical protein